MNPYMAMFVFLGLIYVIFGIYGAVVSVTGLILLGIGGFLFCATGWFLARDYLS